jgi:hypothetical protein
VYATVPVSAAEENESIVEAFLAAKLRFQGRRIVDSVLSRSAEKLPFKNRDIPAA